jgi:hypothetical protein
MVMTDLREQIEALEAEREQAKGSAKGALTRKIKALREQLAESSAPAPLTLDDFAPHNRSAAGTSDLSVLDTRGPVAVIVAFGQRVQLSTLEEAVALELAMLSRGGALDGGPSREDAGGQGDRVVDAGLLDGYRAGRWNEGRWCSAAAFRRIKASYDHWIEATT